MRTFDAIRIFHALGNQERLEIFDLILRSRDQGIHLKGISESISIAAYETSSQLKILLDAGLITKINDRLITHYMPAVDNSEKFLGLMSGVMFKIDVAIALRALSDDTRIRILRLFRDLSQVGISTKVISAELNMEYVSTLYHLNRLLDARLIGKKGGWGSTLFFPVQKNLDHLFTHLNQCLI